MSLLGIDVGTTGCKAGIVTTGGDILALAYREYPILHPEPGHAELDMQDVWHKVREVIREVAEAARRDPVTALAVSSMGEAMTPVRLRDRTILDRAVLGIDTRGEEYVVAMEARPGAARLHEINGNILGLAHSAPKLAWLRDHRSDLFERADMFMLTSGLISFLLGGEAVTDRSLANRTLLLDIHTGDWSDELLADAGIPRYKLPPVVPAGTPVGEVDAGLAEELGLPRGVQIITGGHDQCCNALGAGVVRPGRAVYGMGTFICITPAYDNLPPSPPMLAAGLNTEHHVLPGLYVSFIYNIGGSILRWARDTMAAADHIAAQSQGRDVYDQLMAELPASPTDLMVLPHFATCGPPTFDANSSGVIMGLKLETTRGQVVKGLLEGLTYYFGEALDLIPRSVLHVTEFRATGGGSKSDVWLQLTADILGQPIARLQVNECGLFGAALLAGVGSGAFASGVEASEAFVHITRMFEPRPPVHTAYQKRLARYKQLYPLIKDYLHGL
jgi:xylulokinase